MVLPLPLLVRIVSSELYKFSYEKEEEKRKKMIFFLVNLISKHWNIKSLVGTLRRNLKISFLCRQCDHNVYNFPIAGFLFMRHGQQEREGDLLLWRPGAQAGGDVQWGQ